MTVSPGRTTDPTSRLSPGAVATDSTTRRLLPRWTRPDVAAAVGFTALAVFVLSRQWRSPASGYLVDSGQDQRMWEWFFAVAARSITHLDNPLGTVLQNYPQGVNLMANTAMFGVSIPLAPITLVFGPTVTWTLVLTAGLAGTAFAWYWLLARYAVQSRAAAAIGGLFCGYAPAMISHANGHPNFVVLALLPLILGCVIRLGHGAGPRTAVLLGLLVAAQIALGEEPLLITALTFAVFTACYFAFRPRLAAPAARHALRPLLLAAAIALVLTAAPLWWQFFGPQSYHAIDHGLMGNDLKAVLQFPTQSLGGHTNPGQDVAINPTEQNAYFGWPLLALVAAASVWLRRSPVARAASVTTAVMIVLSLGSRLMIGRSDTGIELPWKWIANLPLLESVLETRFAMGAVPAIALLLALATDRALRERAALIPWCLGLLLALLPLAPAPLEAAPRPSAPAFFTDGIWRDYVTAGSVVTVPLPRPEDARALTWQIDADFGFPLAGGYFVGPVGPDKKAKYGPDDRPTASVLAQTQKTGIAPEVTDAMRAQAVIDLKFWRADVLVLPRGSNERVLRQTVQSLLGDAGHRADDVWVWDVRALVAAGR
ncbi:glycosyl transferase [Rhodococcus sp. NPDC127528]|uniref:glycosyl transferase n=1 Tax=unclassified Rhodococcus (in: high G+C Gram-positive bacteria) TaxID=192944 RepID=UPI00363F3A52